MRTDLLGKDDLPKVAEGVSLLNGEMDEMRKFMTEVMKVSA